MLSEQRLYVRRLRRQVRIWKCVALVSIGVATASLALLIIHKKAEVTQSPIIEVQTELTETELAESYPKEVPFAASSIDTEPSEARYPEFTYSKDWDATDAYLLAKIAMAEAEDESIQGKSLVILTVLNRVWNPDFPDTIHDVIFQPNQFEPIINGRWDSVEPDADCWEAVNLVQTAQYDYSDGALYFESADSDSTWHANNLTFLYQVGNQKFYK